MVALSRIRHRRWPTPPSSVYSSSGAVGVVRSTTAPKPPCRSENIRKMGLKFARVALSRR